MPSLRPGLHSCKVGARYIFFDLSFDRYFLLAPVTAERFERYLAGTATAADEEYLLGLNLLARFSGEPPPPGLAAPAASRSLVDEPGGGARLVMTIGCLAAQAQARRDLGCRSLSDIVGDLSVGPSHPSCSSAGICADVAAAFQRARRYTLAKDQCLVRGIAMKRMLARRGCAASLVFGVTLPFAAHCWVQVGKTVLTDPLHIALHYQPIFAV